VSQEGLVEMFSEVVEALGSMSAQIALHRAEALLGEERLEREKLAREKTNLGHITEASGGGGNLCPGGGPHDFTHVSAQNEKKSISAGLKAIFVGTGGGANAKKSSDKGQRVILYCKKCGAEKIL